MSKKSEPKFSPETVAAQGLGWIDQTTRAVSPPVHVSTTYERDPDNLYRSGRNYSRTDNPTYDQPEAVLASLEGGKAYFGIPVDDANVKKRELVWIKRIPEIWEMCKRFAK